MMTILFDSTEPSLIYEQIKLEDRMHLEDLMRPVIEQVQAGVEDGVVAGCVSAWSSSDLGRHLVAGVTFMDPTSIFTQEALGDMTDLFGGPVFAFEHLIVLEGEIDEREMAGHLERAGETARRAHESFVEHFGIDVTETSRTNFVTGETIEYTPLQPGQRN